MTAPDIHPNRLRMRNAMAAACENSANWRAMPQEWRETMVRRIERSCFTEIINSCICDGIDRLWSNNKFVSRYSVVCSRVLANIDPTTSVASTYLIDGIINGTIDPIGIATLDSHQMCPEASSKERAEIQLRQQQKIEQKVSHAYICPKCKGTETMHTEYTGRALDEAAIKSIKCVNCGHVWR